VLPCWVAFTFCGVKPSSSLWAASTSVLPDSSMMSLDLDWVRPSNPVREFCRDFAEIHNETCII